MNIVENFMTVLTPLVAGEAFILHNHIFQKKKILK